MTFLFKKYKNMIAFYIAFVTEFTKNMKSIAQSVLFIW